MLTFLWRIGNQEEARIVADHFAFSAVSTSCQLVALVEAIFARGTRDDLCRVKSLRKKKLGGGVGGGFLLNQKFWIFETGTNAKEISWERFTENPEIVEFPEGETFNWKFRKFKIESVSNRTEISRKKFSKLWVHLPSFSEIMWIRNFLFNASSFGRDYSELDNLRKDDSDAYGLLQNIATCPSCTTRFVKGSV